MPQQRRSRYTVVVQKPSIGVERKVVMTYGPAPARAYFEGRGYTVLQVSAGDYRKQQRAVEAKREGGYRIDYRALREACDTLGIKLPVKIRQNSRVGNTNGNHRFAGGYHDIMLKSYLTAEQATKALWHELAHAVQAERAGTRTAWAAELRKSRGKYQRCPLEIEARRVSAQMSPANPLTRR